MNQILLLTNPYEYAQNTLEYGLKLASELESEVRVLHVVDQKEEEWFPEHGSEESFPESDSYDEMLEKERVVRSEQIHKWISHYSAELARQQPITLSVDVGFVRHVVRNYIRQNEVSLILVCQHQASSHNYGISLSQSFNIPVLICNPENKYVKPGNFIFGTSYEEKDIDVLHQLTQFADKLQANIQVVHVARKVDFKEKLQATGFQRQIQEKIDYKPVHFQSAQSSGIKKGLLTVTQNALGDVIVLGKKKKNIFQELVSSHSVRQIVNESEKPVLVFPFS
ncbi:MAG: universal stress protein [Bacteroidetes bacterium]|jgi:nucleotide-binding universal stress UspA family protein|nr:universal stress protein [Bacteroidota bacterium]